MTSIVPLPRVQQAPAGETPLHLSETLRIEAEPGAAAVAELLAASLRARGRRVTTTEVDGPATRIALRQQPAEPSATATSAPEEAYTLDVTSAGVELTAPTRAGLFRGSQTLLQLLPPDLSGAVAVDAVHVEDSPRFAYRGVMLDVVRHFFAVDEVLGLIDALALLKINHLHLHLTDDQGWRIEIDSWPRLTSVGARGAVDDAPGGFYTKDDLRRIIAYAAERYITVVPEIDLPGHTNAALSAYPELNADGVAREPYHGVEVGFSSLSAAPERAEATDRFLRDVLGEVAALTPGPWLHIGGDESWSTPAEDYRDLVRRITATAAATGKRVIGWHEIGASEDLPAGTVAQYWSYVSPVGDSADNVRAVVAQGGQVIMSPADAAYLDMAYPEPPATPGGRPLGLDWADGATSLAQAYGWEPTAIVDGISEADILGVEGPLWAETTHTMADVEYLVFPRVAALAEIGWSPAGERDAEDFVARVAALGPAWDAAGIRYARVPEVPWAGAAGDDR
ncbi:beta-N-acetylhexosaminidase [Microbacterium sp. zg.Y1084]|uniref:beta-N-acetylhexosaminidase n=1 Tax=Microbacterium sp. zg.Y1084 TaxID=2969667 RepID=UPI00214C796F|nr:beta-N-acetylhexosaminidase [Microbacterium sp. zg.Y1084]MCR2812362.1 beta-N-acetylhexosaminidase [Microbacterium sp. zg.Y1084]